MTKSTWIDKSQLTIMSLLTAISFALSLSVIINIAKNHPKNPVVGLVLAALCLMWPVLSFHYWPVRIVNNTIILARCGFMRFGRKAVPISAITEIKITDVKKWDEGGRANIYSVVRVIDNCGEKYRNIIFNDSIQELKAELVKRNRSDILREDETRFEIGKKRLPENSECLSCGETFSTNEDKCPKCGWSWKA